MSQVEQCAAGFGCRVGTIGPVVVAVFESKPELGLLDILVKTQSDHIAKHGRICSISVICMPRLAPPEEEFRVRSAQIVKQFEDKIFATALIILSTGAAAVVARAFLAVHALLVHQKRPQQTFRQIADAVTWMKGLPDQAPAVKELHGLAEAVEAFTFKRG